MMPTLFLATEADEGMGHTAPWAAFVALALQQGFGVHMAAPNVGQLAQLMGGHPNIGIWQAPIFRSAAFANQASPKSWPELLLTLGYGDTTQLVGAVKAWLSVLTKMKPSVVLADYAPALLAAARVAGIPSVEVGSGFCVPPLLPQVQQFPGVKVGDRTAMDQAAGRLTQAFKEALRSCGHEEAMTSLSDMSAWPARRVVVSAAQLDHYGQRPGLVYAGFLGAHTTNATERTPSGRPLWLREDPQLAPAKPSSRVLGYLKPATPGLQVLIAQLRAANITAHLVVPQDKGPKLDRQGSVTVVNQLIDLPQALPEADIYLSNGGLHGVGLALHAGCWPVVVPMQAEQVAMARHLVALQWGGLYLPDAAGVTGQHVQTVFAARPRRMPLARNPISAEDTLLQLVRDVV